METIKTTTEFLDSAKAKHGLTSDYQLAKLIGCTHSAISNYRSGKSRLDDSAAMKVAELLDLDPAYVIACIHAEREKNEALKKIWKRIAESMAGVAALLLLMVGVSPYLPWENSSGLALIGLTASPQNGAFAASMAEKFVYYVKPRTCPIQWALRELFGYF